MQSEKSRVLLFLSFGDRVLQRAGGIFTLAGTAAVLGVMGSGTYHLGHLLYRMLMYAFVCRYLYYFDCVWGVGNQKFPWKGVRLFSQLIQNGILN
jgi:hypothetical protein